MVALHIRQKKNQSNWTKGGGDVVGEQMKFERVLAALRWSSEKHESTTITMALIIDMFVLFPLFLLFQILFQSCSIRVLPG